MSLVQFLEWFYTLVIPVILAAIILVIIFGDKHD